MEYEGNSASSNSTRPHGAISPCLTRAPLVTIAASAFPCSGKEPSRGKKMQQNRPWAVCSRQNGSLAEWQNWQDSILPLELKSAYSANRQYRVAVHVVDSIWCSGRTYDGVAVHKAVQLQYRWYSAPCVLFKWNPV
jgi:hypothetical protein